MLALSSCGAEQSARPTEDATEAHDVMTTTVDAGGAPIARDAGAGEPGDAASCRTEAEPNDQTPREVLAGVTCGELAPADIDLFTLQPRKRTRVTFSSSGSAELSIAKLLDVEYVIHSGEGFTVDRGDDGKEWRLRVAGDPQTYMIVITELP